MGNLAQSSDSDLLFSFCQKREERAFTLLAQRHHEMMYRTTFRILANEEDARDVLQAALIVFAKRASELGTRRSLGNWLLWVVIMESTNLRRKRARQAHHRTEAMKKLYKEWESPLRTNARVEQLLDEKSFDEWPLLLKDGQVLNKALLSSLGHKLAKEDPERALQILLTRQLWLKNLNQFYAFRDSLLHIVAQDAPEKGLAALQAMERGGTQMDHSLYFSSRWAQAHAAGAAEHFEELVILRNMNMNADLNMPRNHYVNELMRTCVKQDSSTATSYVEELPSGATKATLAKALEAFAK